MTFEACASARLGGGATRSFRKALMMVCLMGLSNPMWAQLTFSGAASLAVRNSPRVKMAEDDVQRAAAALSETKDYYIPTLSLGGGLGRSYGITLTVPTIVTINSQSLVYSPAQRDYIRAAKSTLQASQYALQDVRQQVEEDAAVTCISLEAARSRVAVLAQQADFAERLVAITKQRFDAGLDSELEWKKARRALLQIQIQQPPAAATLATIERHLSTLTGVSNVAGSFDAATIPSDSSFRNEAGPEGVPSLATLSSEANSRAKSEQSHGDSRYRLLPQILMQSQYGRISPINNVSDYYNLRGHYNVAEFGVAIQFSFFDKVRSARNRESAAVALHSEHETEALRDQQDEDQMRSQSSLDELTKRAELALLDRDIATEQLAVTLKEVETASADVTGRQLNPKDAMYARIDERQHYLDWIEARLQLQRAQISMLRQTAELESWLSRTTGNSPASLMP